MLKRENKVELLSIDFAWGDLDCTQAAIPLFPNHSGWTPENRSAAAYSIADTREIVEKGQLKIRARFQKNSPGGRIQVRTRDVPVRIKDIFTGEIRERYPAFRALGNVKPTTIFFNDDSYSVYRGKHSHVPLSLEDVLYPELGVGIYDVNWAWEYRLLNERKTTEREDVWQNLWRPLTVTQHRIFVVLQQPQFPWTPMAFPDCWKDPPYAVPVSVDALYFACEWARGAQSPEEAAQKITDKLNGCGRLVYDVNPHYFEEKSAPPANLIGAAYKKKPVGMQGYFYLSKMLERLLGGHGHGENANCVDCALTVMALSNLLGCNLQVGRLQNSPNTDTADPEFFTDNRFEVNPILAMGHPDSATTLTGLLDDGKHYFSYHSVAWQGAGETQGPGAFIAEEITIYDASLRFAGGSGDPGDASGRSAAGWAFVAEDGTECYRDLLAANTQDGRERCVPQPVTVVAVQLC